MVLACEIEYIFFKVGGVVMTDISIVAVISNS